MLAQSALFVCSRRRRTSKETEEGIPLPTDPWWSPRAAPRHAKDEKSNLTRISWVRHHARGLVSQAIKRMVRQNGLQISPAEARAVIKYLATEHGLAH